MGKQMQSDGAAARGGRDRRWRRARPGRRRCRRSAASPACRSVTVSNEVPGIVSKIRFESGAIATRGPGAGRAGRRRRARPAGVGRGAARSREPRRRSAPRCWRQGNVISHAQLDEVEAQLRTAHTDTAAPARRRSTARSCARRSRAGSASARSTSGQYLTPGTTITTLDAIGGTFVDFTLPQEELASVSVGHAGARDVRRRGGAGAERDDHRRSIRPSTRPPATSRSAPTLPEQEAQAAPGHVRQRRRSSSRSSRRWWRCRATAIVHASYGDSVFVVEPKKPGSPGMDQTPDGKPVKIARQQFVRARRRRAATSSPIAKGVTAGQEVVSAGAFKLRNDAPVVVDNTRQADAAARPAPREPLSHEVHRHLPPPAGAGDRGQPADRHRRPAGDPHAQRAPVPEARERDRHGHAPSTSAPAPIWCAASSPRRSSAPSPPPTASTTSSRRASRGSRPSTSACKLNFNAAERAGRHQRARRIRCAPICRPRREVPAIHDRAVRRAGRGDVPELRLRRSSQDNQVTDYLIRVVQPRLSAIDGVQRADILGGAHVRAARLAEARSDGGAQRQPVAGARRRSPPTTTWPRSGRPRARWSS